MPYTFRKLYRRVVSLLLTLAVLFSCLPAQAAGMSVQLKPHDASTVVPVGTTITYDVLGTGTAAVALMVVLPDSRQKIEAGASHDVTFSAPGLYVIAGYGANGTDEKAPGFARCMSPFHIVEAVGEAQEEFGGRLVLEGYTKPEWSPLRNAEMRWNELELLVTLEDPKQIPEDAMLQVDLYYNNEQRTVFSGQVGTENSWIVTCTDEAKALLSGGSGEPEYDRYAMSAAASVYTADGKKITAAEPFVMGWYSPEMLYVNDFFDNSWVYGASHMGKRLQKWLDMSERKDGDRSSSGFLMLEQEILFREDGLNKFGEMYVKFAQKALSTISSLGLNLAMEGIGNIAYEKKFGEAGKKALPYYNMLASVYNSYAQTLLQDMQKISRGAYIAEQIAQNTQLVAFERTDKAGDFMSDAAGVVKDVASESDYSDIHELLYIFQPLNADSDYLMLRTPNRSTGTVKNYEVVSVGTQHDETWNIDYMTLTCKVGDRTESVPLITMIDDVIAGDMVNLDTTRLQGELGSAYHFNDVVYNEILKTYGSVMAPKADPEGGMSMLVTQETVRTITDASGKRKVVIDGKTQDLSEEIMKSKMLDGCLSAEDQEALWLYRDRAAAHQSDKWGKVESAANKVMKFANYVGYGLDVYSLISTTAYQSDLQAAYFNTYMQVSGEYLHTLTNWCKELKTSGSKDAEYILAAVEALMQDIYASCDASMSKAAQKSIVFTQTVEQWGSVIYDTIDLICDIPAIKSWVSTVSTTLKMRALAATKSAVNTVVQKAVGQTAANAAAGTASGTAASAAASVATVAKAASSIMMVVGIGSFVYDLLMSAFIGHLDSIHNVYNTKDTLVDAIESTLRDYGAEPTHQRAVDIIESLYLMKELKIKGENLVISFYLMDMFKDFDLEGVKEQLVLMNEIIGMDSNYTLKGSGNIRRVYAVYENYIAGSRDELKEAGVDIEGIGGIGGGDHAILDSRVVGVYRADAAPFTFQGVALEKTPAAVLNAYNEGRTDRKKAYTFDIREPDWIKDSNTFAEDWQTNMVSNPRSVHFVKEMWAYSHDGLDLLLTEKEKKKYEKGEAEVNRILRENDDATGDELGFWDFKAKDEWQYQQRIVWTLVTRKYIESLPMFDRTTGH